MRIEPARLSALFRLPFGVLTDVLVAAYALWTIAANAVVIAGGTTPTLVVAGAVSVAILLILIAVVAGHDGVRAAYLADAADAPVLAARRTGVPGVLVLFGIPAVTLLAWLATYNAWVAWAGLALSSLCIALQGLREPPSPADAADRRAFLDAADRVVLYTLAFACAAFTALTVRPRADDTFYLNMAVSVADYPSQALLSLKNLHGPASDTLGVQKMFAPYRVHSFEVLGGLFSYLTGVQAVRIVHLWFAPLLGWFAPFAVARLLRLLAPRHYLLGVVCVVAFYAVEGTGSRGYSNHAFVRLFNGKSALLTVGVPLICAYGLRFGLRPSPTRFALLALAQIAGMGLSSTGLWLAPTLATIAVVAGTPSLRRLPLRLSGSLVSSGYVVALGLWVITQLGPGSMEPGDVEVAADGSGVAAAVATAEVPPRFVDLADSMPIVFGESRTAIASFGVILVAAVLAPNALGSRLLSLLALALAAGFGNPFLSRFVSSHVTGETTYQRIFWLLPVAVALGMLCVSVYSRLRERRSELTATTGAAAVLAGFLLVATGRLVISERNRARLVYPPALKLWGHARAVAEETCKWAPKGTYVLASPAVSLQLPILHRCGYPLATNDRWLTAPADEKAQRNELLQYVGGQQDIPISRAKWFVAALGRYHVDVVVLSREAVHNWRVKSLIRLAGFERVAGVEWEHIFAHARPSRRAQDAELAHQVCRFALPGKPVLASFGVSREIQKLGCAQVLAAPEQVLVAPEPEVDQLLIMERETYYPSELSRTDTKQYEAAITRHDIGTVALCPQSRASRKLRALFTRLGFHSARPALGASVLVREAPDAE